MKLQLTDIQKELSKRSLSYFIKCFWNYIDPAEYIHNWHIDAISEHLEAVTSGQIKRLIINIPPRHQKSLTVAVFWPAWHWITKPSTQWLFSSYAHSLSIRDSAKCRSLIQSPLYQAFFGDIYQILPDQNTKLNFKNNKNGCRIATSVGGSNTGEGANILCFPTGTRILTEKGEIDISEIVESRLNIRILSYNHDNEVVEFNEIIGYYEHEINDEMIEIEIDDEILVCTKEHPIFVEGKGYIPAENIKEGDIVIGVL